MTKQTNIVMNDTTKGLVVRDQNRQGNVRKSVMNLVGYFITVAGGDPNNPTPEQYASAEDKVDEMSFYLLSNYIGLIEGYERGNKRAKTQLLVEIDNINEVTYPYMDAAAKQYLKDNLNAL